MTAESMAAGAAPGPAPAVAAAPARASTSAAGSSAGPAAAGRGRRLRRLVAGAVSLLLVAGIFGFALPRFASYNAVLGILDSMSWAGIAFVAVAFAASQVTTWAMMSAVLPGLRLRHAAAVNLGSSAVANTVPGGGAIALGVSWAMLSGWGVTASQYVQYTLVSGLWNVFARLGLPVLAVLAIVAVGHASLDWQVAAYLGAGVMVVMAVGLWALLRSEPVAAWADRWLHRALASVLRLARRQPPRRSSGLVLDFRAGTAELLAGRWLRISATTLASHLSLWLVLLACLRASGVTGAEVGWAASLAAFAFVRLLSVLPITPGGVGLVELGLTGPLAAGLDPAAAARVTAAVLLFRAATYLLPLPAGAGAYVWWRQSARRRARATAEAAPSAAAPAG